MASRVVLFGATGYTGGLVAAAMAERGMRPVLAARGRERLEAMAAEMGGLETAVADVADPMTVRALAGRGDVLVTTVGPFSRWVAPRSTRRSGPAPTTSTRPASRGSSAASSSARDRGPRRPAAR